MVTGRLRGRLSSRFHFSCMQADIYFRSPFAPSLALAHAYFWLLSYIIQLHIRSSKYGLTSINTTNSFRGHYAEPTRDALHQLINSVSWIAELLSKQSLIDNTNLFFCLRSCCSSSPSPPGTIVYVGGVLITISIFSFANKYILGTIDLWLLQSTLLFHLLLLLHNN